MSFIFIIVLYFVCVVLYRPGFKFFLLWFVICAGVFCFLSPSAGIWGFFGYFFVCESDEHVSKGSNTNYASGDNCSFDSAYSGGAIGEDSHRGSSYSTGDITNYSNGNSSVRYGDVTYFNSGIRSVQSGSVTYYFDGDGREMGRSVDNGNGVHTYFDTNNRELGHSFTSGRITDFIGNCFEI